MENSMDILKVILKKNEEIRIKQGDPWVLGISFLIYRLSGGNIHRYNSFGEVFDTLNLDVVIRLLILFFTLLYMIVPIYLILRYSEGCAEPMRSQPRW